MKHSDMLLGKNNKTFISLVTSDIDSDGLQYNYTYDQICSDCVSLTPKGKNSPDEKDFYANHEISYKINNFGFRSDDFTKESVTNNYMYLGCSNTFGLGVPEKIRWTDTLNEYLGGNQMINVGTIGGNIDAIGYNFFKMVEKFGKPKGVFIFLPDLKRKMIFQGRNDSHYLSASYTRLGLTQEDLLLRSASIINSIAAYCNLADIPFLYSSWDTGFLDRFQSLINDGLIADKHFIHMLDKDVFYKIEKMDVPQKLKENKYWSKSRDGHESGSRHWYASAMFQNKLKEEYGL